MARRGRFGRLPTAAPSLTNTLVAIAREMANTEDQAMMDAWKNGGSYRGSPVTDGMVLAHWRKRLDNVAKNDPLYDVYKNTVTQYEYAIDESKHSLLYKQGKISDAEMGAFYINWSKKVPRDSEFWRTLQRDGAQFLRAAKAKATADRKIALEKKYQDAQAETYKKKERAGEYLSDVLGRISQSNALTPGANLSDFDPSDPAKMVKLLGLINGKPRASGGPGGQGGRDTSVQLYEDPPGSGKFVTAQMVLDNLAKYDTNFTGYVSPAYVTSALRSQMDGQSERIDRADKTGHKTDAKSLRDWQKYTSGVATNVNAWSVEESYQRVRDQFLRVWSDPGATPEQKTKAFDSYNGELNKLAALPGVDMATKARLIAEATGDGSVDSLAESFTGLQNSDHTTTAGSKVFKGDIADTWRDAEGYRQQIELVNTPDSGWVWSMGEYKDGLFVPTPGGREIGAATAASVMAASPETPAAMALPQVDGSMMTVYVTGVPIMATMKDADQKTTGLMATGPANASQEIGTAYDVIVMGQKARLYSFLGSDGITYYTHDEFWDAQNVKSHDSNGAVILELDAYGVTKRARLNDKGQQMTTSVKGKEVPLWDYYYAGGAKLTDDDIMSLQTGKNGMSIDPKNGNVLYNPMQITLATDPTRNAAGIDPNTDNASITMAAIMSLDNWRSALRTAWKDQAFRDKVDGELHEAAGYTFDPKLGWVGGDVNKLQSWQGKVELALDPNGLASPFDPITLDYDRATVRPMMGGGLSVTSGTPVPANLTFGGISSGGSQIAGGFGPSMLPSDQSKGTQFSALGDVFMPGTNLFKKADDPNAIDQYELKRIGTIRVPSVPASNTPTPNPVTTPTIDTTGAPTTAPATSTTPNLNPYQNIYVAPTSSSSSSSSSSTHAGAR